MAQVAKNSRSKGLGERPKPRNALERADAHEPATEFIGLRRRSIFNRFCSWLIDDSFAAARNRHGHDKVIENRVRRGRSDYLTLCGEQRPVHPHHAPKSGFFLLQETLVPVIRALGLGITRLGVYEVHHTRDDANLRIRKRGEQVVQSVRLKKHVGVRENQDLAIDVRQCQIQRGGFTGPRRLTQQCDAGVGMGCDDLVRAVRGRIGDYKHLESLCRIVQLIEVLELLLDYRRFLMRSEHNGDGRGCRVAVDIAAKRLGEQCQHDRVAGIDICQYRTQGKTGVRTCWFNKVPDFERYVPRTRKIALQLSE